MPPSPPNVPVPPPTCTQVVDQKDILHSLLEDVALLHGGAGRGGRGGRVSSVGERVGSRMLPPAVAAEVVEAP